MKTKKITASDLTTSDYLKCPFGSGVYKSLAEVNKEGKFVVVSFCNGADIVEYKETDVLEVYVEQK